MSMESMIPDTLSPGLSTATALAASVRERFDAGAPSAGRGRASALSFSSVAGKGELDADADEDADGEDDATELHGSSGRHCRAPRARETDSAGASPSAGIFLRGSAFRRSKNSAMPSPRLERTGRGGTLRAGALATAGVANTMVRSFSFQES
mmetsp:Transcript_39983/g.72485  ORF Transcript_39983/g.72485 Transcript_39983/m.72485 type:complete len:152 (+) Transcript_39983:501-956(+)